MGRGHGGASFPEIRGTDAGMIGFASTTKHVRDWGGEGVPSAGTGFILVARVNVLKAYIPCRFTLGFSS